MFSVGEYKEMIIQCEKCKRKFRLDNSRIKPPGSNVKCSKCGHIFFASKAEDSLNEDKLGISHGTSLFEELEEEGTTDGDQESAEYIGKEESIFETPSDSAQGEISIVEENEEVDSDVIDIPTEHQTDLEDFIEEDTTENTKADIEPENLSITENEEFVNDIEITDREETNDSIEKRPELFESQETVDNQLGDDEVYSDKSFEEDYDDELNIENIDSISIEEETHDEENSVIENIDEENLEDADDADNEIFHNASRSKIIKSNTGIIPRFIYTFITIAALFIIFIASLIILIKAEILPKGTLPSLTNFVESVIPLGLNEREAPKVIISEHKAKWMNTVNGPVYIVSGLVTNESQAPVHYIKLKSEYIVADKKEYEDTFYAGNTFTDLQLKVSPIQNILSKLDKKNGDIDISNSKKLAGLNYNIQPGESIPFFTVFPADGRVLGLKYKLEVIDYKEVPSN